MWIDTAAGLDIGISMADPLASPSILNPKKFEIFVYPYIKELVDYTAAKTGSKVGLHMCGTTYPIWDSLSKLDLASLSLDNVVELERAKETFEDKFCIMGNVDPVWMIAKGSIAEIEDDVRRCIRTMGRCKNGFAVASGCQIPAGAPKENIEGFVDAVRKFSREGLR